MSLENLIESVFQKPIRDFLYELHIEKKICCKHMEYYINNELQKRGINKKVNNKTLKKKMIELNIPVWVNDKSSYQKRLMKQKWSKGEYSHLKDELSNRMIKINEQTDSTEFSLRGTKGACSRWGSEPLHEKVSCLEEIFSQEIKSLLINLHHNEGLTIKEISKLFTNKIQEMGMKGKFGPESLNRLMVKLEIPVKKLDRAKVTRERNIQNWSNPQYRKNMENFLRSPEQRAIRSKIAREQWKQEGYAEKVWKGSKNKDTKPELKVREILNKLGIEYAANKRLLLGDKVLYPDLLIGDKNVIEVQGDYFHVNPEIYDYNNLTQIQIKRVKRDQERLELYKKFGFKVLYIWETDLKNPDNVEQSIKEFLKEV